jgi:hypothetical protein
MINYFALIIIIFWGLWYLLVAITDLVSIIGFIHNRNYFRLNSQNVELMHSILSRYDINSRILPVLLVSLISILCLFISVCAFYSLYKFEHHTLTFFWIKLSLIGSLFLHLSFILFDEFFVIYEQQNKHITRVIFVIISYFIVFKS